MKSFSILTLLSILTFPLQSQIINGKIIDSSTEKPLEYAGIGILGTPIGSITDDTGNFTINVNGQSDSEIVRISMISYLSQTLTIKELKSNKTSIKLIPTHIQLSEVIVNPAGKQKDIGTTNYTKLGGICGWGGNQKGIGHEIGTELKLGTTPVQIKNLHARLYKQSFDSSLFRLHIRSIVNGLPQDELLKENILLTITENSGWIDLDLRKYNLVLSGDIALSLEWVNVIGTNNKLIKVNGKEGLNVLFNIKKDSGCTFRKWGVESSWKRMDNGSPSFYLTVLE